MKLVKQHGTRAPCFFNTIKQFFKKRKGEKAMGTMSKIAKSYEISDAKIMFVSLVDKAANKHKFLITKSQGNKADFQSFGRILKADSENHYVTGIVYEPMVEDTDGNYMTEAEIEKAAHWYMKNAGEADIQHCFEKAEGVEVVESYVAKSDMEIEGQQIKKGTWLMTMEVADDAVWDSIEKGEITGFSMGGKGNYSVVDVDISDPDNPVEKSDKRGKKGLFKALANAFGMDVIEKGAVKEQYQERITYDNFWTAYYALSDYLLYTYNPDTGKYEPVHDEDTIREALADFSEIITGLLKSDESVFKSIEKAGKKMSAQNKETLQGIHDSLGAFLENFNEEDEEVTKSDVEKIVSDAIQKAMNSANQNTAQNDSNAAGGVINDDSSANGAGANTGFSADITAEAIEKMVQDAVQKATQPEPVTPENIESIINSAVAKAMEPMLKSAGVSTNLNNERVEKNENDEGYLKDYF